MDPFEAIATALAREASDGVVRKVRRELARMRDCRLSGDASPLRNTWEEICAQVQHERSPIWPAYESLMSDLIARETARLGETERRAIWLQTDSGRDWLGGDCLDDAALPVCDDDLRVFLGSALLTCAADYQSLRLDRYLAR